MYCTNAIIVKHHPAGLDARVLRCRCWTCEHCQPVRRRGLIANAIAGQPRTFITLTIRTDEQVNPIHQARQLTRAWRLIRLRWQRRAHLKSIPFISVMEATKAGRPHLHVLARAPYLDQRILAAWAAEIIGSPVVWIERIDAHRSTAAYVTKYVGKEPHQFGTSKRYFQSRDYDRRPLERRRLQKLPRGTFERREILLNQQVHRWLCEGRTLTYPSFDEARASLAPHELRDAARQKPP